MWVQSLGQEDALDKGTALQYSGLGNPMDRSLGGYNPWGYKESDTTEHAHTTNLFSRAMRLKSESENSSVVFNSL